LRAEALLHVLVIHDPPLLVPLSLVQTAARRWRKVEQRREQWRALGITATRSHAINAYLDAVDAADPETTRDAIWFEYLDATETAETADAPS
jgi:hypothetical protein